MLTCCYTASVGKHLSVDISRHLDAMLCSCPLNSPEQFRDISLICDALFFPDSSYLISWCVFSASFELQNIPSHQAEQHKGRCMLVNFVHWGSSEKLGENKVLLNCTETETTHCVYNSTAPFYTTQPGHLCFLHDMDQSVPIFLCTAQKQPNCHIKHLFFFSFFFKSARHFCTVVFENDISLYTFAVFHSPVHSGW